MTRIEAGDGLVFEWCEPGVGRVAWSEPDWLGPIAFHLGGEVAPLSAPQAFDGRDDLGTFRGLVFEVESRSGLRARVRAYAERALLVFRIETESALDGIATGRFDTPAAAWPAFVPAARAVGGAPADLVGFGHGYTEFALPTFSGAQLSDFFLLPEGFRPAVVMPLFLIAPGDRALMLAPLDRFHEQVVCVPRSGSDVRAGWHGDLDFVPEGFATEFALWAASGPRALLERHGTVLRERAGTPPRSRYADDSVARLSYWTDNGSAYWYRTEPELDVASTLERTLGELRSGGVPIACVQLDSWFYPHATPRPFGAGPDMDVPPTGLVRWDAREDVLPDGVRALRRRLGDPPLIVHSRHYASASPYWENFDAWIDGERAHPIDPAFFEMLMDQAAGWGAIQYEQDWLVEMYLGVRELRAVPGRARAWQTALHDAAVRRGMSLQWCMATPADFYQTVALPGVASIRTSGDYRYRIGPGALWTWFLFGNALARSLGLWPFKDVFLSDKTGTDLDGDKNAEIEALLATLSGGPVGIGDRLGHTDADLCRMTCRADGVLVKPDAPLAALDRSYAAHPHLHPVPLVAETYTDHPVGRYHYLVALNTWRSGESLDVDLGPGDVGAAGAFVVFDWRRRTAAPATSRGWSVTLPPLGCDFRILCPRVGGLAVLGDPDCFASVGDRRLRNVRTIDGGVSFEAVGAPGERFEIWLWSEAEPAEVRGWRSKSGAAPLGARWDAALSRVEVPVEVGDAGWTRVEVRAG